MSKYKVLKDNLKSLVGEEFEKTLPIIAGDYEDKIKRQAAEITRLLRENKELKEQIKFDLPTLISEEDKRRMDINKARSDGQNEAWELARKIAVVLEDGGWSSRELIEIFNTASVSEIFDLTYPEAAAKVEAWKKAKEEIKVGDEVEKNDLRDVRFIVTFTNGRLMSGVDQSGLVLANEKLKEWHKTGRHIDVDSFLKQIGEE